MLIYKNFRGHNMYSGWWDSKKKNQIERVVLVSVYENRKKRIKKCEGEKESVTRFMEED